MHNKTEAAHGSPKPVDDGKVETQPDSFYATRDALRSALDRITREEQEDPSRSRKSLWAAIGVIGNVLLNQYLDAHPVGAPEERQQEWVKWAGALIDKVNMTAEDYQNEEVVEFLQRYFVLKEGGGK